MADRVGRCEENDRKNNVKADWGKESERQAREGDLETLILDAFFDKGLISSDSSANYLGNKSLLPQFAALASADILAIHCLTSAPVNSLSIVKSAASREKSRCDFQLRS
jgi:hypothetical protein